MNFSVKHSVEKQPKTSRKRPFAYSMRILRIFYGYSDPKTEEQQTIRATFKKKSQFASAWWKQNRPSSTSANGTEAYLAVMKAYKAQHKIGNPYSYLRSLVTDDLKVMLAGNDLTGGVKPGGSTTEGGGGGQTPGGSGEVEA